MKLLVEEIKIDGGTQSRREINNDTVSEYADALRHDAAFPPVTVFFDGADYWLADGFHRLHAHREAGLTSICADVKNGTKREAVLFSVGANASHGLRRTNADKHKAVKTLLNDSEWCAWSDNKIAGACGVSHTFVSQVRAAILQPLQDSEDQSRSRTVERGGKIYQQKTANIGKKQGAIERLEANAQHDSGRDVFGPSPEEIAEADAAIAEEKQINDEKVEMLLRAAESNAPMQALIDENDRLLRVNAALQSRLNGLMGEKDAAVRSAKYWKSQAEKLGYVAK